MNAIANGGAGVYRPGRSSIRSLRGVQLSHILRAARADLPNIPRYSLKYTTIVLALLGLVFIWASRGDGPMPPMKELGPSLGLDPYRTSSPLCVIEGTSTEARWEGLAPALAILEHVNPTVGHWVERSQRDGKLFFTDAYKTGHCTENHLAKYDMFRRELTISRSLFAENDGTVATILCHEYRHSRQQFPTTLRSAVSRLLVASGDPSIVENDALLYEREAYAAVFGTGNR